MKGKILSFAKKLIGVSLLIYFGFGVILFIFQNNYIYYPNKTDLEICPPFSNAEKISFGSSRGYFTQRSLEKVIVYYHGNAGRACDRNYLDIIFAEKDYSTYFVEYSGYAEKRNKPSMTELLKNVTDTINFLKTKNFTNVVVIGESIGVGPAAYHSLYSKTDDLILITAYNNFADVAFSHYPIYPVSILLRNNFTPDKWLSKYNGRVSIILAEDDEFIPNKLGQKLYEDIPSNLKKIYFIKNAGHNTIYEKEEFNSYLNTILK